MHVRGRLCVCTVSARAGAPLPVSRSPPAAAPGQQQPSVDSYSADYHIGARMKIRRVRLLFMPPNSLSACLSVLAFDSG